MTPPSGYTEDALIERPAIALLAALGWQTVNAYHEFDHGASSLGRETKDEVVLKSRLREALLRLNPEVLAGGRPSGHRGTDPRPVADERGGGQSRDLPPPQERRARSPCPIPKATARRWRWCGWWTGTTRPKTTSCSARSSGSRARCTPGGPTWWASSTACRSCSSNSRPPTAAWRPPSPATCATTRTPSRSFSGPTP